MLEQTLSEYGACFARTVCTISAAAGLLGTVSALAASDETLVAYWNFNRCDGRDASGQGHHGTLVGAPMACSISPLGDKALVFDGTSNYMVVPDDQDFNFATALTIAVWLAPTGTPGWIYTKHRAFFTDENNQLLLNGDGKIYFYLNRCFVAPLLSSSAIPLNDWSHVAVSYDGANARIYVNGKLDAIAATVAGCDVPYDLSNVQIGRHESDPGNFYKGAMDGYRIYQRTLSAAEIRDLYSGSQPAPIRGTSPWGTRHVVTCRNVTRGTAVVLPPTRASGWDCEAGGLEIQSDDVVQVTIDGSKR